MVVIKRNGAKERFTVKKIENVLYKVFNEPGHTKKTRKEVREMAKEISENYKELQEIDIEKIQDDVEYYLMKNGYHKEARSYIRKRHEKELERENPWSDHDDRQDLILQKYLLEGETKKEFIRRISLGNYKLEKIFRNKEALWGGRILYGIGREGNVTLSNCYVARDPEDTLEDIYRADYDIAKTYSTGGGQGLNLSKLRPRGAKVNNASNTTPGVMVFAEKYSHTTLNTQQEKRRGALMLVLNIDHPDIVDFATAKLDINKINGANISVAITDEFMKAVENDEIWTMKFETPHEIIEKRVPARNLMELIAYANHTVGDPGMLFIDNVNNYHLLSEYPDVKFTACNPCGEQPLAANGSCNLASVNLFAFVRNPFTEDVYFDFPRFKEVVHELIIGLDEILTLYGDRHPLKEQREHVTQWREVGLGAMGLADLALGMGVAYGSDEFIEIIDEIFHVMANQAAQTSAMNAKEKGVFPRYDYDLISKSRFFQEVYTDETKEMIKKYGLRNSRLLSIAPTGSISNIAGVSGGVEPYYLLAYTRTIKSMFEDEKVIWVYEKTPKMLMDHLGVKTIDELPEWAKVTSQNIPFEKRAKVQATIQKYVDTGISSTFNIPNHATVQDIIDIYMISWKYGLKGATVFRDNCRKIGILSGGGARVDKNPATPPKIQLVEKWFDKKTGKAREFITNVVIDEDITKYETINDIEKCPICGSPLIKANGCTKCSDPNCYFEKCAI